VSGTTIQAKCRRFIAYCSVIVKTTAPLWVYFAELNQLPHTLKKRKGAD